MDFVRPSSTDRIRVAYVQPHSVLYGSERSLLATLRHLNREKFEPHVFLPTRGPLDAAVRAERVAVHYVPWLRHRYLSRPGAAVDFAPSQ